MPICYDADMALAQMMRSEIGSNKEHKHICCQSFTATILPHLCGSVHVYQLGLTGALPMCQVLIDGRQLVHAKVVNMYSQSRPTSQVAWKKGTYCHVYDAHNMRCFIVNFNFALMSWVSIQGPTPDIQTKAMATLSPQPTLQATNVIIAAQALVNKPACSAHTNELHVLP